MQKRFSEEDLISEIISRNIPDARIKDYELAKLHLKTEIKDIITDLTIIEARVKVSSKKKEHTHQNEMQFKNPCQIHNGGHEWEDCRQNPKNQQDDGKNKNNENNCR